MSGSVLDQDPASLAFVERRGYTIRRHGCLSTLKLADFDERRFAGAENVEGIGCTINQLSHGGIYTQMTTVDRECRGRGVALALKVRAVLAARRYGVATMQTGNDSLNAPCWRSTANWATCRSPAPTK